MTNAERYQDIFVKIFHVEKAELNESFTFKSVNQWDSLAHISLISELEEAFGILFETEDILHYGSYLNGMEILKKYGIEFERESC